MKRLLAGLLTCGLLGVGMMLRADAPASNSPALQVAPSERQFFDLGYRLGTAAFAYAELGKEATRVAKTRGKLSQLQQLAALAPLAARDRAAAQDGFARAQALLEALLAPPSALAPVQTAADRLARPLKLTGDARRIAVFNHKAAQTLASLDEFNALSSVPDDDALRHWLIQAPSGQVWYAEGLVTALGETADAQQMPDLLPPVKEIATDLRGLRDWLALRIPDAPTPDQAALVAALNDFLSETSRTGRPQDAALSPPQLQSLGDISRRLQAQILGGPAAPAPAAAPMG